MSVFYDAKVFNGINALRDFLSIANEKQHRIISVTQREQFYTVIYEFEGNL